MGLLQRGDRPLREEAGGRLGAQRGGSAGQSAWRKSGAARSPHPGVGSPGEAGRGGAQRSSEVPGSGSAGAAEGLTEARQVGVGQRLLWTPGRSTLSEGERPVNARGASSRQKFQTGLEAPPRPACGPAPARRSPSDPGIGSASGPACALRPPRPRSMAERSHCAGVALLGHLVKEKLNF